MHPTSRGFPGGSDGNGSSCNVGDPVQPRSQEDPLEKEQATHSMFLSGEFHGAWRATLHGVTKSQTQLSN